MWFVQVSDFSTLWVINFIFPVGGISDFSVCVVALMCYAVSPVQDGLDSIPPKNQDDPLRNCTAQEEELSSPCQWPLGLKFLGSDVLPSHRTV